MSKIYILILVILSGCKQRPMQGSGLSHELGTLAKTLPYPVWFETNDDEYHKYVAPPQRGGLFGESVPDRDGFYNSDDAIVKSSQKIIDKLVDTIQKEFGEAIRKIPRPRVKIIKKEKVNQVNAFVSGFTACFDVPLLWNKTSGTQKLARFPAYSSISPDGYFSNTRAGGEGCKMMNISKQQFHQMVKWVNESFFDRTLTKCMLIPSESEISARLSEDCEVDGDIEVLSSGFQGIQLIYVSNVITVYESIIELMKDESKLAAIYAHELIHYYKAHSAIDQQLQNYFYELKSYTTAGYPTKDASLNQLGNIVKLISPPGLPSRKSEGAKYFDPIKFLGISLLRNDVCGDGNFCPGVCVDMLKFAKTQGDAEFMGGQGANPSTLETKLDNCAASVVITQSNLESEELAKKKIGSLANRAIRLKFEYDAAFIGKCVGTLGAYQTFREFLEVLNRNFDNPLCDQPKALQRGEQIGLGYYTTEQEADDTAMEVLQLSGYKAASLIPAMALLAARANDPDCSNWKKMQEGRPVPVLKDYRSVHHETCFRLDNIHKEMVRHSYPQN